MLTLAPMPGFSGVLAAEQVQGINLVDQITSRTYDPDGYRFFNDVPVPTNTEIFMNEDGSISLIHEGIEIGKEFLYANTRRRAQDVRYHNLDGTMDYVEEYAFDGNRFSNLFYYNNELQEMVFYDNAGNARLRFFYYGGALNFITIEDPQTHKVQTKYNTQLDFYAHELAKIVGPQDTVTITYLGVELDAVAQSPAHNVLEMVESPLDDTGAVRGNLAGILQDEIPYIQEVRMTRADRDAVVAAGMSDRKITVIDD
ncbi:hypothetical protein FD19_GL001447 [Lacticaseibacillus thailandensis DSM 22698 = JCM 13996]|uniref:Uncharacterized protein n=2 Tax=Lacticaseibacillus thailandensis TaxID=381741 RepID=A0A0R2CFS6_9LACO|nr:hypothetical protein FD19_GL001447 [Lacticaseibacillus thailandensis DSM 22698 = JCM 13996]